MKLRTFRIGGVHPEENKIICGISILLMAYTIYIMFFSKTYLWKEWYFGFYGNFLFGLVLVISSIEAIRRDLENS